MAKNLKLAAEVANAMADAVADLCDGGKINIYDGSQPASPDTEISDQTLLAQCTFGTPAFGDADDGVATANAITKDSSANATGTASWFRVFKSDGLTPLFDGSVGVTAGSFDCVVPTTSVVQNVEFSITSFTITQPKAAA
jgi:hypothetical protein